MRVCFGLQLSAALPYILPANAREIVTPCIVFGDLDPAL
jgi:hypothetical protein